MKRSTAAVAALAAALALPACRGGAPFEGLGPARDTGGPRVRFDLTQSPLPEVPFPNDLLTRPDPLSPTGLRVNASLIADGQLGVTERGLLDQLDGWGTFAPISVSFSRELDWFNLWLRQNAADPELAAVFLIDLGTGQNVPLDFNGGRFPYELPAPGACFLGDPLASVTNLLFPVDGTAPNLLHAPDPLWAQGHGGVPQASDDLLGFYERSTHSLILRPAVPLRPEATYAVVLTDKLTGDDGLAVVSPFSGINHAAQSAELAALPALLPRGAPLSQVVFTWAFTTQSISRTLEALRAGLAGRGPLSDLQLRFPVVDPLSGQTNTHLHPALPAGAAANPILLPGSKLAELLADPALAPLFTGGPPAAAQGMIDALAYVDYLVFGDYLSPDLLADPDRAPGDTAFQLDLAQGTSRATAVYVPFLLAVPKTDLLHFHRPPFPVALAGHGAGASRLQVVSAFAGTFAKFGVATLAIDAWGHGPSLPPAAEQAARDAFAVHGVAPLADAALAGRARDLDGDGVTDSGGDLISANAFHTRDVLRQTVVDWLQLVRLLRSFDGANRMLHPGAARGLTLAGDFDDDGVPDVGGSATFAGTVSRADGLVAYVVGDLDPGADRMAFGVGLGGVFAALLPALEPSVRAAVTAGGGGLADVLLRTGDPALRGGLLEAMGPILATCAWSASEGRCGGAGAAPTLVWEAARAGAGGEAPIAPLSLAAGDLVTACNLARLTGLVPSDAALAARPPAGCAQARAQAGGELRLPLGADGPFALTTETAQGRGLPARVAVTVVRPGDRVRVLVSRAAAPGAAPEVIDSFAADAAFAGVAYPARAALRAPARGHGEDRNSPAFRRRMALTQAILDPADPINYATSWSQSPLAVRSGLPANVVVVAGAGDGAVPTAAGVALARAAGLVEGTTPDPAFGLPVEQVLIAGGVLEGVSRLRRFADGSAGPRARLPGRVRCGPPDADCSGDALLDASGLACGPDGLACTDGLAAPRLSPPLQAQLQRTNHTADGNAAGLSMLLLPLFSRDGQAGFGGPQPQRPFDTAQFVGNLAGRYFETRGKEIRLDACQAGLHDCPWTFPPP